MMDCFASLLDKIEKKREMYKKYKKKFKIQKKKKNSILLVSVV